MFGKYRDHKKMTAALFSLIFLVALSGDLLAQTKPKRSGIGGEPPRKGRGQVLYWRTSMQDPIYYD